MIEGTSIGQYRVLRKIGEGGMGAVYLAEHTLIGRQAAIKVLLPQLSMQKEIVDRFFNEARATSAIPDPGIVQVFDFGLASDGSAYIVMEFLEGEPLDVRMKRVGRLTAFDALRITRQAAGSLFAAHHRGIVHRDLKPENIFLVRDQEAQGGERPKVLDFGIAKFSGNDPNQMRTRTGAMMGTPVYMSPEQCRGAGTVDHRSDIYSMGCVLFHMITGRPPFEAEGIGDVIVAHLREPPRPPSAVISGLPEGVDQLVLACLAKSPDQRFQSMGDLQKACDVLMSHITGTGTNAQTLAIATPVPPGFRSEYPGASHSPIALAAATQPPMPGSMTVPHVAGNPSQPGTVFLGQPTTLGAAAGQASAPAGKKSKTGLIALLAVVLIGGGVAAAVVLKGGGGSAAKTEAAKPQADTGDDDPGSGSGSATASGSGTGSASGSGSATAIATPDAGVAAVAPDAAVTATVDVTPPDAGPGVAIGSGSGSGSTKVIKKKIVKKTHKGSGSGSEDLYGDR